MKTIVWHMNHKGFFLNSDNIDIRVFHEVLGEIVGNVGDVVLTEVYKNLKQNYPSVVESVTKRDLTPKRSENGTSYSLIQNIESLLQIEIGDSN